MIVLRDDFKGVIAKLSESMKLSFDCETSGLHWFKGDRLFAAIFYDGIIPYYFNFWPYNGIVNDECVLPRRWLPELNCITQDPNKLWFAHNARFDLHMLHQEGVFFGGEIHCTEMGARLEYNDHMSYSLDACVNLIGLAKDDAVEKYIQEHRECWDWDTVPGQKSKRAKKKYFYKVPLSLVQPYGEQDAVVCYELGQHQLKAYDDSRQRTPIHLNSLEVVAANERKLVKTCLKMESRGILINKEYCLEAIEFEKKRGEEIEKKFFDLSGIAFKNSSKVLAQAFTKAGEKFPTTKAGNPSFSDAVLEGFSSPLAKVVQEYRDSEKRCNTYFRGFLHYADSYNVLHPNMRQAGTKTGRFSYTQPNLQNLSKEESGPFPVRRAFVPRPGFVFVEIDYDQIEFRLMLDNAEEISVIDRIKAGHDPHQATADEVKCSRLDAKIINFGVAYGMGKDKLAIKLGTTPDEAGAFRRKYFRALPNVRKFLDEVEWTAKRRGFVFNWFGRISHFPDGRFCYRAPNSIIQGGAADIAKIAMNRVQDFLEVEGLLSQMLIQVHDSILFEVHESEFHIVPRLKEIMESTYPYKFMPLTCSVEHSFESMFDMKEGMPGGTETGDVILRESSEARFTPPSQYVL